MSAEHASDVAAERLLVCSLVVPCQYGCGNGNPPCEKRATGELWGDGILIGKFCDRDLQRMRLHFIAEAATAYNRTLPALETE